MIFKKLRKFTITPFYISLRRMGTITPDGYVAECDIMPYITGVDAATGEDRLVNTVIAMNPATAPVGNMDEIRAEVVRRWESSGILVGLEGKAEDIAKLFENQKSYLINEPEEFAPRRSIASRYATKMVDNRYYEVIRVSSRGFGIQFKRLRKMPFGTPDAFEAVQFPIIRRVFAQVL